MDGDKHFRRIDIKVYPREQYGFALLYFTGSGQFNRELREHALSMGMTLSDHGLYKQGSKKSIANCETEAGVFKALKREYVKPSDRDI